MEFLQHYEQVSGQKVNADKSTIVVSRKMHHSRIQSLRDLLGYASAMLPIKYLGAPLYIYRGRKKDFLFDEIVGRLERN